LIQPRITPGFTTRLTARTTGTGLQHFRIAMQFGVKPKFPAPAIKFPARAEKFPAPLSREFAYKQLMLLTF
jgi:hypothetical protein